MTNTSHHIPRVGMFATVRNRRGVISAVEDCDGDDGRLHLVHLDYKDDQRPHREQLLWEIEPRGKLLEPTALPDIGGSDAMPHADYDALLRAARWTSASPYLDPDGDGPVQRMPVSSPFHGAVQVEDYQLIPLLKALRMPRVNLLIADDVGLGKTIEAGLILSELLLRRRIQRVLILTPAALRLQWRDEMWEKFSLPFDLVDRAETHRLQRRLGMDANPWRSFSRIITSYHYLRQEDVLEQFHAACRTPEGSPHLPWDLLIVDECHNLMPSAFGDDSDLCRMLRQLAPQFEHRLFLSATPHNGHTRCFTGLLEILDPVRFSQTSELKPAERARMPQVVIRRLKREINERSESPKFCTRRPPRALLLPLSPPEAALSTAFGDFRKAVKKLIAEGARRRRFPGTGEAVSRWTVRRGGVPEDADALVLFSLEELAVNDLRESFHHWVHTLAFPVKNGELGAPLEHRPARALRGALPGVAPADHERARTILEDVEPELKRILADHAEALTRDLKAQLKLDGEQARLQEDERYKSRQGEVSSLIAENTVKKLEREVAQLVVERDQGQLFDEAGRLERIARSIEEKEQEIARRKRHYEEVREQLEKERERILKHLLPRRHALSGAAQVFPVSLEVRLPGATGTDGEGQGDFA